MGDGINDAPALRAADVGISVDSAVDVAKESADIILLEKSLHVLEHGVIEGRKIFFNITKYIRMAMSAPLPAAEDPARLPDRPSDVSAPEASQSEPAKAPVTAPVRPAYDVTDFLAGVFEGLPGSADLSLDCVVDPRADTLAVERLLYFSQALQLLFSAFRSPGMDRRHPAEKTAPQRLHIRLDLGPGERIGLRLYDDGHFFAQLLPSLHWDEEALRPLRLFVSRKGGSLCLRRGRCVEFEIIG